MGFRAFFLFFILLSMQASAESKNQFLYTCVDPMGMVLVIFANGPGKATMHRILPMDGDYTQNALLMHYNLPDQIQIRSVKADTIDPNYMHFQFSVQSERGWRFRGELVINSSNPSEASLEVDSDHPGEDGSTVSTHLNPRLRCDYKLRIKNPYRAAGL